MPYVERTDEELIAAYERWLARHAAPDEPVFIGWHGSRYSPRQLLEAIKNREEWAVKVALEYHRYRARIQKEDPVEIIDRPGRKKQDSSSPERENEGEKTKREEFFVRDGQVFEKITEEDGVVVESLVGPERAVKLFPNKDVVSASDYIIILSIRAEIWSVLQKAHMETDCPPTTVAVRIKETQEVLGRVKRELKGWGIIDLKKIIPRKDFWGHFSGYLELITELPDWANVPAIVRVI